MQTFESWHPVSDVPEFLSGVFVVQPHSSCMSVICDGKFSNGQLLVLRFEEFEAVTTHEEFAHQWLDETGRPELPMSPGGQWTFPFLKVANSHWAANSNQARDFDRIPIHYVILSGSDIVDVLAFEPPQVLWASIDQVESVLEAVSGLGGT